MTLHSVRHGSAGSTRPLVLVHGLGSSGESWSPVAPALAREREVVLVDLPGFGRSAPLPGEVTIATLTDALQAWLEQQGLVSADLVGSSMGARMVLELARRGVGTDCVALDPGGFWTSAQQRAFGLSIKASVALVRRLQPALPVLLGNAVTRTALLAQFSARPWALDRAVVLRELRGYDASPSLDDALRSLVHGPVQQGAPAGTLPGRCTIGWGRRDRVTLASQAAVAQERFPDAVLHWFDGCGHFPQWDRPDETVRLVLDRTG